MKTKTKQNIEDIIAQSNYYYVNSDLTSQNFHIPDTIQTENWKIITMPKSSFSSQEALDEIKRQGCRPAHVYELAIWANNHREELSKNTWCLALGQVVFLDGYYRVPSVDRDSDGGFEFNLGYFEDGWSDDCVLLAFCDTQSFDTLNTGKDVDSLTLDSAIALVKEAGYQVSKIM